MPSAGTTEDRVLCTRNDNFNLSTSIKELKMKVNREELTMLMVSRAYYIKPY